LGVASLSSPVVTLIGLVIGMGAALALVAALLPPTASRAQSWALAATIVAVVALVASWVPSLRDHAYALDQQRKAYSGTIERTAREQCAKDFSRPDLPGAFGAAREQIPEDARFALSPATMLPCFTLNLEPRLPAPDDQFDRARDWVIYDQPSEAMVRAARRDRDAYPVAEPTVIIARPGSERLE
jgi:hypothetical protein